MRTEASFSKARVLLNFERERTLYAVPGRWELVQ